MFRLDDTGLPENVPLPGTQEKQFPLKKSRKRLYGLVGAVLVVAVLVFAVLFYSGFNLLAVFEGGYPVEEHMVYFTTNIVTNQVNYTLLDLPSTTNTQSINITQTIDIVKSNTQNYTLRQSTSSSLLGTHPSFTVNVSKVHFYNNQIMAPGGPLIFNDTNINPITAAYLSTQAINVGDSWTVPVNTGNASLGLTGEITLQVAGFEDITVPAGTFRTIRIGIETDTLTVHSDGSSIIKLPTDMTLKLTGTTYLDQDAYRLIKADLTQLTTTNSSGTDRVSTLYTEKTLIEWTKP